MSEKLELLEFQKYTTSICKEPKKLTSTETAYLAGFIDGEGSLFIQKTRKNRYIPTIRITNTDKIMVDFCNEYGGFWLCQERTVKWKPVYRWILSPSLCKFYLPQLLPYLKIKRKQALVMMEALKECRGSGYPQNKELMEKYRKELQRLNARPHPKTLP